MAAVEPVTKIVIDTDPGIDDAMAIHFAFAHPGIRVLGLTTVFGNVNIERATRNARWLAEHAAYDCDVAEGAGVPLATEPQTPPDFVHGKEGFGALPPFAPRKALSSLAAHEYLCRVSNDHPGEITLLAVGPLTNLALALRQDPELPQRVARVIVMGGALNVPGNVSEYAEANIIGDPEAADAVFTAGWPITMVGLDVTTQIRCTPSDLALIADEAPGIGGFLRDATDYYFDFHQRTYGERYCYMHDPATVAAAVQPDLFKYERTPIRVACTGENVGQTMRASSGPPVDVCIGVDTEAVKQLFIETTVKADLRKAERDQP